MGEAEANVQEVGKLVDVASIVGRAGAAVKFCDKALSPSYIPVARQC